MFLGAVTAALTISGNAFGYLPRPAATAQRSRARARRHEDPATAVPDSELKYLPSLPSFPRAFL